MSTQDFFSVILQEAKESFAGPLLSTPVGGGCINHAARLEDSAGNKWFVKWQEGEEALPIFTAEQKGLALLHQHFAGHVPEAIANGSTQGNSWLLMTLVESGPQQADFWEQFGQQLAALHQHSAAAFGLDHDNYIGSLPQYNTWKPTWADFFIEQRLLPQLAFAERRHLIDTSLRKDFDGLFKKLPDLMPDEPPALLHGDLWSGNFMREPGGEPCLIDPAVYYGHREMEIAFTRLFGGFDDTLYQVYQECHPLEKGFEQRRDLCNLYPLLVHLNLFGTSYLPGIRQSLSAYIN